MKPIRMDPISADQLHEKLSSILACQDATELSFIFAPPPDRDLTGLVVFVFPPQVF